MMHVIFIVFLSCYLAITASHGHIL